MTEHLIYTKDVNEEEKVLRGKTLLFSFDKKGGVEVGDEKINRADLAKLLTRMRKTMHKASGIGLAANQIGLPYRLFVAELPSGQGPNKFYAIFNPELSDLSKEKASQEEGCLSVPGFSGEVARSYQVTLRGLDRYGKPIKVKAWGLLARVFQHEVDHLNGILFIDKTKNLIKVSKNIESVQ